MAGKHETRRRAKALRREMTKAEWLLWLQLRQHPTLKFRRQHPIGPYIADFACISDRLVVELDGESHNHSIDHDAARTALLEAQGWSILRFPNSAVYQDTDAHLTTLISEHA